mmetsp:Transcript_64255/g.114112  ORF Transcript_64255/g.114112 Transcript_64255/m.114112 type:complete len:235 (+) Transcript_64255:93-797(+)
MDWHRLAEIIAMEWHRLAAIVVSVLRIAAAAAGVGVTLLLLCIIICFPEFMRRFNTERDELRRWDPRRLLNEKHGGIIESLVHILVLPFLVVLYAILMSIYAAVWPIVLMSLVLSAALETVESHARVLFPAWAVLALLQEVNFQMAPGEVSSTLHTYLVVVGSISLILIAFVFVQEKREQCQRHHASPSADGKARASKSRALHDSSESSSLFRIGFLSKIAACLAWSCCDGKKQ